jgi:hypothetical protein
MRSALLLEAENADKTAHEFQSKFNFLTLAADAALRVDLFGRLRRATEAACAELLATDASISVGHPFA